MSLNSISLSGAGDAPPDQFSLTATPEPDQPLAPPEPLAATTFQTSLKLTPEQEERMMGWANTRKNDIYLEMGLDSTNTVMPGTWMDLRRRYEQSYEGDFSWRASMGSIFSRSNLSLGSGQRHVRYISARVQDDLLGTEPFFAAMGAWPSKEKLAQQLEEYIQQKLSQTNVRAELREAQKVALIRNEAVIKTTYVLDETEYIGPATVYCDQNGAPLKTPKGLFIYQGEQMDADPAQTTEGMLRMSKDPSVTALPQPDGSMIFALPQGMIQAWPTYMDALPQKLTKYDGVKSETLDYRAFICPLRMRSIQDADTCGHIYTRTPNQLRAQYGELSDVSASYFGWWAAPGAEQPKYEQGETDIIGGQNTGRVVVFEQYLTYDPFQDGKDREILLVWDVTNQKPIYYNYLAIHYKRRPFDVLPGLEKVPNRWYGRGIFGLCYDQFLYEDAQFNRLNFKDTKEASATFAYRDACLDWNNGISPVIGGTEINWLNPSYTQKDKPPLFRIKLTEDMENGQELLTIVQQAQNAMIGSINSKDASTSDMNQSKTATGIVSIQQASDVITKATESEQIDAINSVLDFATDLTIEHMDAKAMIYQKGEELLATLNQDECRNLPRDVRLLLTRSKSSQLFQSADQSIQVFVDFRQLMQTDLPGAKAGRPLFISKLKALECDDPDDLLPEITDEDIQAWQASRQNTPPAPPAKSISTKYTDLLPSEQAQVLQSEGITPGTPKERAAQQATDTQTQLLLKNAAPPQQPPGQAQAT